MKILLALLAAIFAIGLTSAQAADSSSANPTHRRHDLSYWHRHHHHHHWYYRHHYRSYR